MRKIFIFLLSSLTAISLYSHDFTRKDSLRGTLSQLRTCYDVNYYNLFVIVDEIEQSLERSYNEIYFTAVSDFEMFQIDLASNMEILLIEFEDNNLNYSREFDAVFVRFPRVTIEVINGNYEILHFSRGHRVPEIRVWNFCSR